ncbi:hypothetical protein [Clostridium estertheticum]|uniref:GIY-YIG domain-containing protein n=1 Tax=Clostridium estertheticum TaxID=238834 RepID=A0AA47EK73_9CLOT|nr:hypothetical protein [Clostridium estertheticum]MBU3153487.1 hypothetical protein [Clostridium estertheticum]WAG60889.1 hypothetical protein LL038_01155 [Clostridium estertheticum]
MKNKMEVVGNIYVPGVYGMRVKDTEEFLYVGSGSEINDCLSRHCFYLKRGLYEDTNKSILQEKYDLGILVFEVIKESEYTELFKDMSVKQKEALQIALGVLEKFYIDMYKETICNQQMFVKKHSSNKNAGTTMKRRKANLGKNNPNSKYSESMISEILWLKMNGYTSKQIEELYSEYAIKDTYIYHIGVSKWIHLEPVKPSFIA